MAIVGAGPIGLELAIALKQRQVSYVQFEKEQIAQMIYNFPPRTHFFSSNDRIAIAGFPIQTLDQQKCSREEYLAYIRTIVMHYQLAVNNYEEVKTLERLSSGGFLIKTFTHAENVYQADFLVLATGGTYSPRMLGVPGESLPHVSSKMDDPHKYFLKKVLVVGGKNSAAETALRCFHAGAKVSLAVRKEGIDAQEIKYWIAPELLSRISKQEIDCYTQSKVVEIRSGKVLMQKKDSQTNFEVETDFVIKAIGFDANMELFHQLGVKLVGENQSPLHDSVSMETNIDNVFVLGTIVGGTQKKYLIFIENTHIHISKILKTISNRIGIIIPPTEYYQTPVPNLEE